MILKTIEFKLSEETRTTLKNLIENFPEPYVETKNMSKETAIRKNWEIWDNNEAIIRRAAEECFFLPIYSIDENEDFIEEAVREKHYIDDYKIIAKAKKLQFSFMKHLSM